MKKIVILSYSIFALLSLSTSFVFAQIDKIADQSIKDGYFISMPTGGKCIIGSEAQEYFGVKIPFTQKEITSTKIQLTTLQLTDGSSAPFCLMKKSDRDAALSEINEAIKKTEADANFFLLNPTGKVTQRVSGYQMSVPIPCQPIAGGQCPKITSPATYIARLYQFGLMVAGLAAFGSIVYGALQYTLSAGSFTKTEDAKEQIRQAILGLVLLLGAFLILYTINPSIVQLRDPNVQFLDVDELIQRGQTAGGLEQRLGGAPEPHPLCKFGTYTGLNVTVGGSGNLAPTFVCHECKPNASPAGTSDCQCQIGFIQENNQCVKASVDTQFTNEATCNSQVNHIWVNSKCILQTDLGF